MGLIQLVLYGLAIYFIVRTVLLSKRQGNNKKIIDLVHSVDDKEEFFKKSDELISTLKEEEFVVKTKILKLWGMAMHHEYDEFESLLDTIDFRLLFKKKGKDISIDLNEDSFFYAYIAIPNMLFNDNRNDLRIKLENKLNEQVDNDLKEHLVKNISGAICKYYNHEGDLGLSFYETVLNGEYEEYIYSRTMIGLYKSIVNAMACKIYLDTNNSEKYEECKSYLEDFYETRIGHRWIDGLNIEIKKEEVVEE